MRPILLVFVGAWILAAGCREGSGSGEYTQGTPAGFAAACESACRAMYRTPCNGMSQAGCDETCAAVAEGQIDLPCPQEQTALYACAADLSFTCTDDGPQPATVGCVEESVAYAQCLDDEEHTDPVDGGADAG